MADLLDHSVTEALRAWRVQNGAGVDAAGALEMAASVCVPADARAAFLKASRASSQGEGFEKVVSSLREFLSEGERAVVLCGFKSGRADECLDAVVAQRELWFQARKEIRSGMILPIATLFLAALVAPLPAFFAENGSALTYLISVSIPLGIAYLFWKLGHHMLEARSEHGKLEPTAMDNALLQVPVVKTVEQRRNISEFASLLALQLSAGVPITEALDVCSRCLANGHYRSEIARANLRVRKGEPLSVTITAGPLWPPDFISAVTVGEKSGALDDALLRYSNAAREAYTRAIKQFAEWLPRVVYGCVALFIIWNIITLFIRIAGVYQEFLPKN